MSEQKHFYDLEIVWTGNLGKGTLGYQAYDRSHNIKSIGKSDILASSDPAFRGDSTRWNPEEMLLASLSSCHMLWYLHLSAISNVSVLAYEDHPKGELITGPDGSGYFENVSLYPKIKISKKSSIDMATMLHGEAHKKCFIANSVNFPISIFPVVKNCEKI